jgi:hypothetical protein
MPSKPQPLKRKRGVILSNWGLQRLQAAQEQLEITANQGDRYTLEQLSHLTGISARSIRKVRNRQETVDRQTLEDLFRTFQLTQKTTFNPPSLAKLTNYLRSPPFSRTGERLSMFRYFLGAMQSKPISNNGLFKTAAASLEF